MSNTVTRRLVVESEERGADKTAAGLRKVAAEANAGAEASERYARGAQKNFSAAAEAGLKSSESLSRATLASARAIDRLHQSIDPVYKAQRRLEEAQRKVSQSLDAGQISTDKASVVLGKYERALEQATARYDPLAEAQRQARAEAERLAVAQREVETQLQRQAGTLTNLRERYAPALQVGRRYREELAQIASLEKDSLITVSEGAMLRKKAAEAAEAQNAAVARLSQTQQRSNLLSRAGFRPDQGMNLFRQGGDIATMGMMGASPFQILSSQGAQIAEIFADSERGAKGALKSIGQEVIGLTRFVTAGTVALTGMAGASLALALRSTEAEKSLEASANAAKSYTKALDGLGDAATTATDRVFDRKTQLSPNAIQAQLQTALADQRKAVEAARSALTEAVSLEAAGGEGMLGVPSTLGSLGSVMNLFDGDYRESVGQVRDIVRGFNDGSIAATSLIDTISEIKLDGDTPDDVKALVDGLRDIGNRAIEAEGHITALRESAGEMRRMNFEEAIGGLEKMGGTAKTQLQAIEDFRRDALRNATTEADETLVNDRTLAGLDEMRRATNETLADMEGRLADLDLSPLDAKISEINRRYDAELAALRETKGEDDALLAAAEKTRLTEIDIVRKQHSQEATAQSEKEAEAYRKASASRVRSIDEQVAAMRLDAETFGMTAVDAAAYRFEIEAMTAARRAAADAGLDDVMASEEAAIRDAAVKIAAYTARMEEAIKVRQAFDAETTFRDDLTFERDQAGRSQAEQQVFSRLRAADIDIQTEAGQRYAAYIRQTQALTEARTASEKAFEEGQKKAQEEAKRTHDLMKDVGQTIIEAFSSGENALDGFINAFAKLGNANAQAGFDKLFGGLFGDGSQSSSSSVIGALTKLPEMVNRAPALSPVASVSAPSFSYAPANDNIGRLNSALQESSQSALDVARQFDGLNEKANTGVLDSFLMASGNWKGLSAADTAWCASFANAAIARAGGQGTGSNLASSFMDYGTATNQPKPGDIVVLKPQSAGASGHVGFVAGFGDGRVQVFGGNQSNGANTRGFGLDQVRSFRTSDALQGGAIELAKASTDEIAKSVKVGTVDGYKVIAGDGSSIAAASGMNTVTAWNGLRDAGPGGVGSVGGGAGVPGGILADLPQNSVGGFLQSPFGKTALAGVGAFASGMQSGSPVGGALSGLLGGLATGNPITAAVGAVGGLLGGLFGKSKQKKEQAKQERRQAEQAWKQNYQQFLEISDTVNRVEVGPLTKQLREIDASLEQYRDLAKKTKNGDNVREVEEAIRAAEDYRSFLFDNFRKSLPKMTEDLAAGLGLNTEFTKARDAVMGQADQLRAFLDDVSSANADIFAQRDRILADFAAKEEQAKGQIQKIGEYSVIPGMEDVAKRVAPAPIIGKEELFNAVWQKNTATTIKPGLSPEEMAAAEAQRDAELARIATELAAAEKALADARSAAIEGLLANIAGTAKEQTAVEKALDQMAGAAEGSRTALVDLGLSMEETSRRIDEALATRRGKLADDFAQGLTDQIEGLNDRGYLAGFRTLIEDIDKTFADANLLNVDTSLVDTLFASQAQEMVDGAELAGDAFDELITLFPRLSGVVEEFSGDLEALTREIAGRLSGYQDRYLAAIAGDGLSDALAAFERNAIRERFDERQAGGQNMPALEAAQAGEKVALIQDRLRAAYEEQNAEIGQTISRLEGLSSEWADLRRDLRLDDELSGLSPLQQAMEAQTRFRDLASRAAGGDEEAQDELARASQDYLSEFRAYYASSEAYYRAFDEVQGVLQQAEATAVSELSVAKSQLDIAKSQLDAMRGVEDSIDTLSAALTAAMAGLTAAKNAAGFTPSPDGGLTKPGNTEDTKAADRYLMNNPDVFAAIIAGDTFGLPAGMDLGAYGSAHFGLFGANEGRRYATGGLITGPGTGTSDDISIRASNGEFMMRASAVENYGLPAMTAMNEGRLKLPAMPRMPMPANDGGTAALARALREDNREMRKELARLGAIIAGSDEATRETIREGNRAAKTTAKAADRKVRAA